MDKFFKIVKIEEPKTINVKKSDIELINNKYEPNSLNELKINKNIGSKIQNIINSNDIINLFFYGKHGTGKYCLTKLFIKEYLGFDYILNNSIFSFEGKEFMYLKNNYIIEVNINLQNFTDINLITEFVNYICNKDENSFSSKKKIIIFRNIHIVKKHLLILLKNILDKYSKYNTFIFISTKFIPDIFKGFFCSIRVPLPIKEELLDLGFLIQKNAKKNELEYLVKISDNSITKFKNLIELCYIDNRYEKYEDSDNDKLKFLYKILYKKKIISLTIIRELINELFIDNMDEKKIILYLLNAFRKDFNKDKIEKNKMDEIHKILINIDINIKKGFRPIHHFEYGFIKIMNIL